jgi:hypothetical protein
MKQRKRHSIYHLHIHPSFAKLYGRNEKLTSVVTIKKSLQKLCEEFFMAMKLK